MEQPAGVQPPRSILVSVDCNEENVWPTLGKAAQLGRGFGAGLQLFLCDAERAYALKHEYDPRGVERARELSIEESLRYLDSLRASMGADDLNITTAASCESPLYEGVVREVLQSRPDLVIRCAGGGNGATRRREFISVSPTATDWALVRTCPVPVMLARGRPWKPQPVIGAAVDVSADEPAELTICILQMADLLGKALNGRVEVLYSDESADSRDTRSVQDRVALLRERIRQAGVQPDEVHVLTGDAASTLPQFAAGRDYDLLMLGALSHRRQLADLVGTLTIRLIESLDCDFLLVKPATYVCPVQPPAPQPAGPPGGSG